MPRLDFRYLKDFISDEEFAAKVQKAEEAHRTLMTKSGAGNDFTGFVELPDEYDREEFSRILSAAENRIISFSVFRPEEASFRGFSSPASGRRRLPRPFPFPPSPHQ